MKPASSTSLPVPATRTVPEPALRPSMRYFPERYVVRRARVFLDGRAFVVRDPFGGERRIPLDDVARAVWIDVAADAMLRGRDPLAFNPFGALELRDGAGQVLLRLPLSGWTPEADDQERFADSPLVVSDASALLDKAGVPVETVRRLDDPRLMARSGMRDVPVASFRERLPLWFVLVRAVLVTVGAGLLLPGLAWQRQAPVLWLISACALLGIPLAGAAVVWRLWRLDRRDPVDLSLALRPRPAGSTTRRFLRTAHLRAQDGQLVATNGLGGERWLPLSGPRAVTQVVRVVDERTGEPVAAELRTDQGSSRVGLPWPDWFADDRGEALAGFASRAGLALRTERVEPPAEEPDATPGAPWPGTESYECLPGSIARSALRNPDGVPGEASIYQPQIFGSLVALGAFMGAFLQGIRISLISGSIAIAAALLAWLPRLVSTLASRYWLDRALPVEKAR